MDAKRLWQLIGDVYDAAVDSRSWPDVLGNAAGFVGGKSAALYWKDVTSKTGGVHHDDGRMDALHNQLYFEEYITLDPSTNAQVFARLDEPIAGADFMTPEELSESRFYREWMRPQGTVDAVNVVLDKTATGAAMFLVFRGEHQGVIDEEARRRMRLIAPHVRRAAHIGRVIERKTAEAAAFADTFDGLSAGVFLVDADGAIVHANAAAQGLLEAGDVVHSRRGRLTVSNPKTDLAFRDIFRSAREGDAEVGVKGISMPLATADGERQVAHVLPLTSGGRRKVVTGGAAVAALFMHKVAIDTRTPPEMIARSYGLTPAELRVLLAIVDVGGVPESAEALGVAQTTVKWHLGHLYQKTGAERQADLVKLVAGFSSPLLS